MLLDWSSLAVLITGGTGSFWAQIHRAVMTNIMGARNVIGAALDSGVKRVLAGVSPRRGTLASS